MMKIRGKVSTLNKKKLMRKELLEFVRFNEKYRYCKKINQLCNIFCQASI